MATTAFEPIITSAWGKPNSWTLDEYKKRGGYQGLQKALEGEGVVFLHGSESLAPGVALRTSPSPNIRIRVARGRG